MAQFLLILLCLPCLAYGGPTEGQIALEQLQKLTAGLETIEKTVERYEIGLLLMIKGQVKTVQDSIAAIGLGNYETIRKYQGLVFRFNSSKVYLNAVSTPSTDPVILDMEKLINEIARARGVGGSIYAYNTLDVFTQLRELIEDLQKTQISRPLSAAFKNLMPMLGSVTALAAGGDTMPAFQQGMAFVCEVRKLYPMFVELNGNTRQFETAMNIQGQIEFYARIVGVKVCGGK